MLPLTVFCSAELLAESDNLSEQQMKELERENDRKDQMVLTDALTGLYNYRAYKEKIESVPQYALLVIDIDRFKKLNDTYGHAVGDDVLAYLGKLLLEDGRHYDIAARLGGEEFAILLPDTPILQAKSIVERFLVEFRRKVFRGNSKGAFTVTFSAGIASRWGKMEISPAELLEDADRTMYAAKAAGRNTIELGAMSDGELKVMRSMVRSDEKKFLFGLG